CRPSCPAKRSNRDNAVFFAGPDEAEQSGFRPCRRCSPRDVGASSGAAWVYEICAFVDANLGKRLTLSILAAEAGLSPFYFQRTFKKVLGVSPRQYVEARRLAKMKRFLRDGETVNDSLYNAGFSSRSRVYEKIASGLGMNPGTIRQGGRELQIQSIPYGKTATYSGIADALGSPNASRAVARACATNHVALVIPCHRVIGKDGGLHGYRWGNERKLTLLKLEQKTPVKQADSC